MPKLQRAMSKETQPTVIPNVSDILRQSDEFRETEREICRSLVAAIDKLLNIRDENGDFLFDEDSDFYNSSLHKYGWGRFLFNAKGSYESWEVKNISKEKIYAEQGIEFEISDLLGNNELAELLKGIRDRIKKWFEK
jgi:hypothetical protein